MDKDQTKKAIEVMQAYVDGAEIKMQVIAPNSRWVNDNDPDWNFAQCRYRIKPEPREFWLNTMKNEIHDPDIPFHGPTGSEWVKVREVIE